MVCLHGRAVGVPPGYVFDWSQLSVVCNSRLFVCTIKPICGCGEFCFLDAPSVLFYLTALQFALSYDLLPFCNLF